MTKSSPYLKKIIPIGILLYFAPTLAYAEAGKSITTEGVVLALSMLDLIVTTFKKIVEPRVKSSILHYISLAISVIIFIVYYPYLDSNGLYFLNLMVTFPFILAVISLSIDLFKWFAKRNQNK
ncbi:MAG: hypothetical protein ACI9E3_000771 [Flavobacteriales bacterium]|jgi:hypothetical protein